MTAIEEQRIARAANELAILGLKDLVRTAFSSDPVVGQLLGLYALGYVDLECFLRGVKAYAAKVGLA